jgi:hypothetical protein
MLARALAAAAAAGGVGACTLRTAHCDDDDGKKRKGGASHAPSYLDADTLERSARAVREIDRSSNAKAVRPPRPWPRLPPSSAPCPLQEGQTAGPRPTSLLAWACVHLALLGYVGCPLDDPLRPAHVPDVQGSCETGPPRLVAKRLQWNSRSSFNFEDSL